MAGRPTIVRQVSSALYRPRSSRCGARTSSTRVDWIDITDKSASVTVWEKSDLPTRLAHKLGLQQSPGKAVMKQFRDHTIQYLVEGRDQGRTVDQAAMMAAKDTFPAEFKAKPLCRRESLNGPAASGNRKAVNGGTRLEKARCLMTLKFATTSRTR
jgi:hypothetical protein